MKQKLASWLKIEEEADYLKYLIILLLASPFIILVAPGAELNQAITVDLIKLLAVTVGLYLGVSMISGKSSEEATSDLKRSLLFLIIGLIGGPILLILIVLLLSVL